MLDFDKWQEIYSSLKQNKIRTALTAFGVFWGILMLMLLLGAGKGLQNGSERNFGSDDRSSIWIWTSTTSVPHAGMPKGRYIQFSEDDMDAIRQAIPDLNYISAEIMAGRRWQRTINVTHKNNTGAFSVYGVGEEHFKIKTFIEIRAGRTLSSLDEAQSRKVVMIGSRVAEKLFPNGETAVGEQVYFHGIALTVIGVFHDDAQQGRLSERIYMPLSTFQLTFGQARRINEIVVTPKPNIDPFLFESQVVGFLKTRYKVAPKDNQAINAYNYARQAQTVNQLFTAINFFVWFVGLGTLAAGIVGVSNIMIITVKDRTREIGVRKALGATPASIVSMILSESILITAFAGYTGLVLGVALLEGANVIITAAGGNLPYFDKPEVELNTAFIALGILVSAGALAGLAPALHASRIMPIEAMREE